MKAATTILSLCCCVQAVFALGHLHPRKELHRRAGESSRSTTSDATTTRSSSRVVAPVSPASSSSNPSSSAIPGDFSATALLLSGPPSSSSKPSTSDFPTTSGSQSTSSFSKPTPTPTKPFKKPTSVNAFAATTTSAAPFSKPTTGLSIPAFAIYADLWISSIPAASSLGAINVFILAFWLNSNQGPTDDATSWSQMGQDVQLAVKKDFAAYGKKIIVSAFGDSQRPSSTGLDPTVQANALAAFVTSNNLDGADIDYEDFDGFNDPNGSGYIWLVTFITALRGLLPEPYLISAAPLAPWFRPDGFYFNRGHGPGYLGINNEVGNLLDIYFVQFYNQAPDYLTCTGTIDSSTQYPNTAYFQIINSGVPSSKLAIGKNQLLPDGNSGYLNATELAACATRAALKVGKASFGGVSLWQWHPTDPPLDPAAVAEFNLISNSINQAFGTTTTSPLPTSTTTTTTSTSATSTSTSVPVTTNGLCGTTHGTCSGGAFGNCCSQYGYCGTDYAHCGSGCRSAFGLCGVPIVQTKNGYCGVKTRTTCLGTKYGACCGNNGRCGNGAKFCANGCYTRYGTCTSLTASA